MHWVLVAHLLAFSGAVPSSVTQEFDDYDACKQALDTLQVSYSTPYRLPVGFCTPKGRAPQVCVDDPPANVPGQLVLSMPQKCTAGDLPKAVIGDPRR